MAPRHGGHLQKINLSRPHAFCPWRKLVSLPHLNILHTTTRITLRLCIKSSRTHNCLVNHQYLSCFIYIAFSCRSLMFRVSLRPCRQAAQGLGQADARLISFSGVLRPAHSSCSVHHDEFSPANYMDGDEDYSFFSRYAAGGPAVLRPPAPRRTSPNPFDALDDTPAPNRIADEEETPLQQLIRHWMNERHAPDLLPAQQVLLAGLLDHIHRQVRASLFIGREPRSQFARQTDTVQTLRADPSSSEEDHFRIMLVQTEIERVKFIVRSYVRTRLFKVSLVGASTFGSVLRW